MVQDRDATSVPNFLTIHDDSDDFMGSVNMPLTKVRNLQEKGDPNDVDDADPYGFSISLVTTALYLWISFL